MLTRTRLASAVRRLLTVAVLVLVGSTSACTPLDDDLQVTAMFDDSAGLFVGNDVGVLGVPIGEITDITPRGRQVAVRMRITGDRSLPAKVGAAVVSRSVATDRYVELTPAFARGPRLRDGAVIPLARTRTPVEYDEVLSSLNTFSKGLAGKDGKARALRRLLAEGAAALDGRGADVNDTVTALSKGTGALAEHRGEIVGTVRDLDDLTALLAANQEVVRQFIESVSDATDMFATERRQFGAALRSLDRALQSLGTFVQRNRAQLGTSLRGLTRVVENLLEHQAELAEAIEVLPLTLQNTGNAVTPGNRLNVKLPPTSLSPIRQLTDALCELAPADLCEQLGTNPSIEEILDGLLGVTRP